ncbi:MAG: VOC family protein [Planctomycetes bacterium]|nr:VOC family protein [Planctomycetota bacterium]
MPQPIPYLHFPGTCREAVRFYQQVLGAKVATLMTYGESPLAAQCEPSTHGGIMHARLELPGGGVLMAGDCQHGESQGMHGFSLALNLDTTTEAARAFAALADGGTITMPMQATFWAKAWGMLTDRFGVTWLVNGELLPT